MEVQRVQEEKLKFLHEIEQYKSLCETLEQSVKQLETSLANKVRESYKKCRIIKANIMLTMLAIIMFIMLV